MSREGKWAVWVVKVICAGIIFVSTVQFLLIVGPWLETRNWPPVSKLQIMSIEENSEGNTVIDAHFTKVRDCEYLGIAWYHGRPTGEFERVQIVLLRSEIIHGPAR